MRLCFVFCISLKYYFCGRQVAYFLVQVNYVSTRQHTLVHLKIRRANNRLLSVVATSTAQHGNSALLEPWFWIKICSKSTLNIQWCCRWFVNLQGSVHCVRSKLKTSEDSWVRFGRTATAETHKHSRQRVTTVEWTFLAIMWIPLYFY